MAEEMEIDANERPQFPEAVNAHEKSVTSTTIFLPPSVHTNTLLTGDSYAHYSPVPSSFRSSESSSTTTTSTPCVLGIDEAGRGPVLGPMVYGAFYLPVTSETPLLASTYHFNDSKQLTTAFRNTLMRQLCKEGTDLHDQCGWAIKSLSARDISSAMLRPRQYNLNAQAYDATIEIIRGTIDRGVNITQIYVDTVGQPEAYQKRIARVFPNIQIVVEKKADSKFPCVSAASVVAKVTRDVSLEVLWGGVSAGIAAIASASTTTHDNEAEQEAIADWGSGYPSDSRCSTWLKRDIDPLFGWGHETRFSWATAKDLLEAINVGGPTRKVDWPVEDEKEETKITEMFSAAGTVGGKAAGEEQVLRGWFGTAVGMELF